MNIYKTWEELKTLSENKHIPLQYFETEQKYNVFIVEDNIIYIIELFKDFSNVDGIDETENTNNKNDFETNYKTDANCSLHPHSEDSKEIVRSESRPIGHLTCFTSRADSESNIGDGKILTWDFSNDDDEIEMPTGSGLKRKRIEFKFLDDIYIKEGAVYFYNAKKGTYGDVYVVCPSGQYYLDNDGNPQLALEDIILYHYLNHHMIQGDCPMGDELNTEACSKITPNNYKFWIEITAPDTDNESNGSISLEMYRKRTVILQ